MSDSMPSTRGAGRLGLALDLIEKHLPALILLAMVSIFLLQIVCRYFFKALPWPEELVGFLFLWLVCFGVGFAERDEQLIRFEMIHGAFGPRGQLYLNIFGDLLVTFALVVLFFPALNYVIDMGYRGSDVLRINMTLVYAPFMVLLTGLIVRSALRVRRDFVRLRALRRGRVA